jgi:hypothetical protein
MVNVIEMRINKPSLRSLQKALTRVGRIPKGITTNVMQRWGDSLQKNTINSAKAAGISSWSGELFSKGIQWRQGSGENARVGRLFIRQYGVDLDSLPNRFVEVGRGNKIDDWVMSKPFGTKRITGKSRVWGTPTGQLGGKVYVTQKPFIQRGYKMTRPLLGPMIKESVKTTMRG